jgi:hypothetical protein
LQFNEIFTLWKTPIAMMGADAPIPPKRVLPPPRRAPRGGFKKFVNENFPIFRFKIQAIRFYRIGGVPQRRGFSPKSVSVSADHFNRAEIFKKVSQ